MAREREEMHEWWCDVEDNAHSSLCEIWRWKNLLIDTEGEIAKTMKPPKMTAPDVEAHEMMHISYCNSHNLNSPLCKKILNKKSSKGDL